MSERKGGQRAELGPNLDRLTAGVDLGDQWSQYCILGLEGETLSEGQVQTAQPDVAEFFQALTPAPVVIEWGRIPPGAGNHRRERARGAGGQSPADGRIETTPAQE